MAKLIYGERVGGLGQVRLGCSAVIPEPGGSRLLLTRRLDNGQWCLPGGGLDPGESVQETCEREVLEETGLVVRIVRLLGVYSDPHLLVEYPDGNRFQVVVLNFEVEVLGGEPGLSDETTQVGYFTPQEIEALDLMQHHRQRIADYLAGRPEPFVR